MAKATDDRIRATATKREELLSVIASTEHAKAALGRIKLDIAALKGPWYDADALYSDLIARSTDEKKEYKELSESHVKKLFGGSKHQENLKIKENELAELQEWMVKADKARKELTSQLDGMKKSRDSLEKMVAQRTQAQIDLEALYALVFNGPSPTNPEEDMLEQELQKAQDIFDPIQAALSKAATVVNYIALARMRISFAASSAAHALNISEANICDHNTGGRIGAIHNFSSATADRQERHQMAWVRRTLAEASQFFLMAHELDPEVRGFVMPKVADGSSLAGRADSWINTPVTDYLFHREIGATAQGVAIAGAIVDEELRLADGKQEALGKKRDAAGKDLKEARNKLHSLRARIFEGAVSTEEILPVPAYETVTATDETPQYSETVPSSDRA